MLDGVSVTRRGENSQDLNFASVLNRNHITCNNNSDRCLTKYPISLAIYLHF
jgi:hypothetical protein